MLFRFEGNAEEIRNEVHSTLQQVRVLASEKEDLHHHLHSEQQRSRQHHAQVVLLLLLFSLRVQTLCKVLCQALQGEPGLLAYKEKETKRLHLLALF